MSIIETEMPFQIVAHVISESKDGYTARLVLKDSRGYHRVVLGVGQPSPDISIAVDSALDAFQKALR